MQIIVELKQCNGCHLDKPLDDFSPRRAKCKICINLQRAESIHAKALRDQAGSAWPPKPKDTANEQAPTQPVKAGETNKNSLVTSILPTFSSRDDVEDFIAAGMLADIATLDNLAELYQGLANDSTVRKERKEYAAKLETVTQKKIDLKLKLIKSFGLFSGLAKPENEDPLYTPVHVFLQPMPPASCIVEPKFHPEADEIQDLDNITSAQVSHGGKN